MHQARVLPRGAHTDEREYISKGVAVSRHEDSGVFEIITVPLGLCKKQEALNQNPKSYKVWYPSIEMQKHTSDAEFIYG
jgi:hypothetical protein